MASKSQPEPKPDLRAIFLAACRRSAAGKAGAKSSKPGVNKGGQTAQDATTKDGNSNDATSGGTDGTMKIRPGELISTCPTTTPITSAWTATASEQDGLGGQNSTTQVRGENVHFQQHNYIQVNRDGQHAPKGFGRSTRHSETTGGTSNTSDSPGTSASGHIARYAKRAVCRAAWKLCKGLCILIPVMLTVALVHVETGEWLGPRYNRAVGVAAGWVGAIVGGVFSSWTSILMTPWDGGETWHLPLVLTNSSSSTTSARHTFNMPVPSGLGMVIPKSIDRDLEDLCKILGDTSSKERSRQMLQAADELDNNIVAYYDLTRRQVERTMDRLRKFRERGSTHSGVPGSCSAEPATWRSLWMWWRGARVTTRGDVMATRLDELRELLHGRHQDMDAARHHASGGRADQLSRVVEGSCHYARAAREYVGLQIGSGGVVEGIEGSERAGKAVGEKDAG
ncbi:hypothetical protein LY78DRAFT_729668 [Colletotrichum sublineola]|nr:hypothetical protein LY78DRAFT_729668 [Colletotrichum sublineola]